MGIGLRLYAITQIRIIINDNLIFVITISFGWLNHAVPKDGICFDGTMGMLTLSKVVDYTD